jgi:BRO family, N-terminal domain
LSTEYWNTTPNPPEIQCFNFCGRNLQVVIENCQPLFAIADICSILGLDDPIAQVANIDPDWHGNCRVETEFGIKEICFIREPALYGLVINQQSIVAADFYRWIFERLMPLISQSIVPIDLPTTPPKFESVTSLEYIALTERTIALECPLILKKALFDKIYRDLEKDKPRVARNEESFLTPSFSPDPPSHLPVGHDRSLEVALGVLK